MRGLRWCDIDFTNNTLSVQKNLQRTKQNGLELLDPKTKASKRSIAITEDTMLVLKRIKKSKLKIACFWGRVIKKTSI